MYCVAAPLGLKPTEVVQHLEDAVDALAAQAEEAEALLGQQGVVDDEGHAVPTFQVLSDERQGQVVGIEVSVLPILIGVHVLLGAFLRRDHDDTIDTAGTVHSRGQERKGTPLKTKKQVYRSFS